jgi:hypothetical protein
VLAIARLYGSFFRQKFTLEDAIGSYACSLEATMRVTNGIPLGCSLVLPVDTANCVQTLKADQLCNAWTNVSACSEFWYCGWNSSSSTCNPAADTDHHNCKALDPIPSGNLKDNAHLLLPYADWYVDAGDKASARIATLFNRILQPWRSVSNMSTHGLFDFYYEADLARCAFSDKNLHLRMPLDPTHVRFKRTCV